MASVKRTAGKDDQENALAALQLSSQHRVLTGAPLDERNGNCQINQSSTPALGMKPADSQVASREGTPCTPHECASMVKAVEEAIRVVNDASPDPCIPAARLSSLYAWLEASGIQLPTPAAKDLDALAEAAADNKHLRKQLELLREAELELAAKEAEENAYNFTMLEEENHSLAASKAQLQQRIAELEAASKAAVGADNDCWEEEGLSNGIDAVASKALQKAADNRRLSGVFEDQQVACFRQLDEANEHLSAIKSKRPGSSQSQRAALQIQLQDAEQQVQAAAEAATTATEKLKLMHKEKQQVQQQLQLVKQQLEAQPLLAQQHVELYESLVATHRQMQEEKQQHEQLTGSLLEHAGRLSHKHSTLSHDYEALECRYKQLSDTNQQLTSQLKVAHDALDELQAAWQATPPAKRREQQHLLARVSDAEKALQSLEQEKLLLHERLMQAQAFIACLQQRPSSKHSTQLQTPASSLEQDPSIEQQTSEVHANSLRHAAMPAKDPAVVETQTLVPTEQLGSAARFNTNASQEGVGSSDARSAPEAVQTAKQLTGLATSTTAAHAYAQDAAFAESATPVKGRSHPLFELPATAGSQHQAIAETANLQNMAAVAHISAFLAEPVSPILAAAAAALCTCVGQQQQQQIQWHAASTELQHVQQEQLGLRQDISQAKSALTDIAGQLRASIGGPALRSASAGDGASSQHVLAAFTGSHQGRSKSVIQGHLKGDSRQTVSKETGTAALRGSTWVNRLTGVAAFNTGSRTAGDSVGKSISLNGVRSTGSLLVSGHGTVDKGSAAASAIHDKASTSTAATSFCCSTSANGATSATTIVAKAACGKAPSTNPSTTASRSNRHSLSAVLAEESPSAAAASSTSVPQQSSSHSTAGIASSAKGVASGHNDLPSISRMGQNITNQRVHVFQVGKHGDSGNADGFTFPQLASSRNADSVNSPIGAGSCQPDVQQQQQMHVSTRMASQRATSIQQAVPANGICSSSTGLQQHTPDAGPQASPMPHQQTPAEVPWLAANASAAVPANAVPVPVQLLVPDHSQVLVGLELSVSGHREGSRSSKPLEGSLSLNQLIADAESVSLEHGGSLQHDSCGSYAGTAASTSGVAASQATQQPDPAASRTVSRRANGADPHNMRVLAGRSHIATVNQHSLSSEDHSTVWCGVDTSSAAEASGACEVDCAAWQQLQQCGAATQLDKPSPAQTAASALSCTKIAAHAIRQRMQQQQHVQMPRAAEAGHGAADQQGFEATPVSCTDRAEVADMQSAFRPRAAVEAQRKCSLIPEQSPIQLQLAAVTPAGQERVASNFTTGGKHTANEAQLAAWAAQMAVQQPWTPSYATPTQMANQLAAATTQQPLQEVMLDDATSGCNIRVQHQGCKGAGKVVSQQAEQQLTPLQWLPTPASAGHSAAAAAAAATTAMSASKFQGLIPMQPVAAAVLTGLNQAGVSAVADTMLPLLVQQITPECIRDLRVQCQQGSNLVQQLRQQLGIATPEASADQTAADEQQQQLKGITALGTIAQLPASSDKTADQLQHKGRAQGSPAARISDADRNLVKQPAVAKPAMCGSGSNTAAAQVEAVKPVVIESTDSPELLHTAGVQHLPSTADSVGSLAYYMQQPLPEFLTPVSRTKNVSRLQAQGFPACHDCPTPGSAFSCATAGSASPDVLLMLQNSRALARNLQEQLLQQLFGAAFSFAVPTAAGSAVETVECVRNKKQNAAAEQAAIPAHSDAATVLSLACPAAAAAADVDHAEYATDSQQKSPSGFTTASLVDESELSLGHMGCYTFQQVLLQQAAAVSPITPGAALNAAAESRLMSPSTQLQLLFDDAQDTGAHSGSGPEVQREMQQVKQQQHNAAVPHRQATDAAADAAAAYLRAHPLSSLPMTSFSCTTGSLCGPYTAKSTVQKTEAAAFTEYSCSSVLESTNNGTVKHIYNGHLPAAQHAASGPQSIQLGKSPSSVKLSCRQRRAPVYSSFSGSSKRRLSRCIRSHAVHSMALRVSTNAPSVAGHVPGRLTSLQNTATAAAVGASASVRQSSRLNTVASCHISKGMHSNSRATGTVVAKGGVATAYAEFAGAQTRNSGPADAAALKPAGTITSSCTASGVASSNCFTTPAGAFSSHASSCTAPGADVTEQCMYYTGLQHTKPASTAASKGSARGAAEAVVAFDNYGLTAAAAAGSQPSSSSAGQASRLSAAKQVALMLAASLPGCLGKGVGINSETAGLASGLPATPQAHGNDTVAVPPNLSAKQQQVNLPQQLLATPCNSANSGADSPDRSPGGANVNQEYREMTTSEQLGMQTESQEAATAADCSAAAASDGSVVASPSDSMVVNSHGGQATRLQTAGVVGQVSAGTFAGSTEQQSNGSGSASAQHGAVQQAISSQPVCKAQADNTQHVVNVVASEVLQQLALPVQQRSIADLEGMSFQQRLALLCADGQSASDSTSNGSNTCCEMQPHAVQNKQQQHVQELQQQQQLQVHTPFLPSHLAATSTHSSLLVQGTAAVCATKDVETQVTPGLYNQAG